MKLDLRQKQFLERIRDGKRLPPANRYEDRARQFCRKNGLAEVLQNPRRWSITDAGRRALDATP